MSRKTPVALQKAREQESKRSNIPNGVRGPKKAAARSSQPSSNIPLQQEAKPVIKAGARVLKPSRNTNQSPKLSREPVKKKSLSKQRLAPVNGIPSSQSPAQTCEIALAHAHAEQIEKQMQDYGEVEEDTNTTPNSHIQENREPRTCEIAHPHAEQIDQQQMQDSRELKDRDVTIPIDIEEKENQEVEPMQLQMYETKNETNSGGSEDGSAIVAALSLEEYYLSGGKTIAPTFQDFIGQFKLL